MFQILPLVNDVSFHLKDKLQSWAKVLRQTLNNC